MDKILKYSELAKALGVNNASITVAIKHNRLVPVKGQKKIDIDNPANKLWIDKQVVSGKDFNLSRVFENTPKEKPVPKQPVLKTDTKESEPSKRTYNTLDELRKIDLKKKKADLKKTEKETEKLDIQIQKLEGQLIPTDAVHTVFVYAAETFRTTYIQEINGLANIFVERLGGEHKHFIELQRELTEKVDEIQKMVKDHLLTGLKGIISEYKEVRSRGERK